MADYRFYLETYLGGAVPEAEWPSYERQAADQLARYRRTYTVTAPPDAPDAVDLAVCAMAEALYGAELVANGEGGTVQSASIGSVSVSYGGAQAVDVTPAGQARALLAAAGRYLDIYRGVG